MHFGMQTGMHIKDGRGSRELPRFHRAVVSASGVIQRAEGGVPSDGRGREQATALRTGRFSLGNTWRLHRSAIQFHGRGMLEGRNGGHNDFADESR
jgi:hypothetical protein